MASTSSSWCCFSVWTSCSSCALRIQILEKWCCLQGCDASILISSTSANSAERDHPDNNIPQVAFDAIIQAKKAVEAACPGVVSCADILVMAARDSVVLTGGPHWDVPKGRRDGMISQSSRVRLPGSDFNLTQLMDIFQSMNLTATDLVVLSGGHTIGFSHCNQFSKRLYNYDGQNMTDPSMNSSFAQNLMAECPKGGEESGKVEAFDVSTPFGFDNAYFKNLQLGQGLLFADQVLFTENLTRQVVNELAASQDEFFTSFVSSMIKMSNIGLKTGQDGEIRSDCTAFNSNQSLPNSRGS